MKSIASDAEWRSVGPRRAKAALATDLRGFISNAVFREARQALENSLPGLKAAKRWRTPPRSEFDCLLQGHAATALLEGRAGAAALPSVLRDAISEHLGRIAAVMRHHVVTKDRKSAREFSSRVEAVFAETMMEVLPVLRSRALPFSYRYRPEALDLGADLRGSP
jgi:hypothetical protein